MILQVNWLVSVAAFLSLHRRKAWRKMTNRIRGGGDRDRWRQIARSLFVAPSLLCAAAPPSMWLSVITCSLLCRSRPSNHRSRPLFTSSAPHLLSLFTFTLSLSSSLPSFIRAFLLLSVHPSPSLQLSLSHHTATILGSNWLNNTFRLPKTSTGKVFPPSVIKLWSDHDGFVPARMIHLQYIGLCMPTTVLFCLRYTINSKLWIQERDISMQQHTFIL